MGRHVPLRVAGIVGLSLFALTVTVLSPPAQRVAAKEPELDALAGEFIKEIRPLVERYCQRCHGDKRSEAEINLEQIKSLAEVRKQTPTWLKAREMLDSGQMPPEGAKQPSDAERAKLQKWVRSYLTAEAKARAGDPGSVVLRRLSNAEYTHTVRDLTGVESLQPAREFPVDGAAGEGFTNTGSALVMSPALLTKYLDAGKEIASHMVLLPDGVRFSPYTTRRDWTDETLARIRSFYSQFTDSTGGTQVNLQGIISETNQGGRLPLARYLAATLAERESLTTGGKSIAQVAQERGLNAKYLATLWMSLNDQKPSLLLDRIRAHWMTAKADDVPALVGEIASWQKELWRFTTVGHIGKVGGPKAWQEPVNPLVARQDVRLKIPVSPDGKDVVLSLVVGDAGDGKDNDVAVWQQPRLIAPGRPDLLLRDVRAVCQELTSRRERIFADTVKYLDAAYEALVAQGSAVPAELARKHGIEADALRAWLDYLGIGTGGLVQINGQFTSKIENSSGYDFIKGWGKHETPLLVANSSNQHVRIPGNMKPHSVAVHPSPTLQAVVGWRSPIAATMRVETKVIHAHPECGNGVTWSLELRRGATRQRLAAGVAQGNKEVVVSPIEQLLVLPGDLISLLIGPRDGNHACDLTMLELKLTGGGKTWNLAEDVSGDIHAGNPHADRFGNAGVWHFYTEPDKGGSAIGPVIPAGSLVAKWQSAQTPQEKQKVAKAVQKLLTSVPPASNNGPDATLYRQLSSLGGPLLGGIRPTGSARPSASSKTSHWGIDPAQFGNAGDLSVRAPSVVEVVVPADLAAGFELVTTAVLEKQAGAEGSVQVKAIAGKVAAAPFQPGTPILVSEGSGARKRFEAAFEDFRSLFPAALCYTKIVPVDEVVTLTLFYREDDQLARLMLDDPQRAQLNRLWDELHYISHHDLSMVDVFAQLMEYASQDADPKVFEPLRKPIQERAAAFRKRLVDTQPRHLDGVLDFAALAYRRPLTDDDKRELAQLYRRLREQEISHDEAIRLTLARVLVAPAFLYRLEQPGQGAEPRPVSSCELASRLSYFLWSGPPDVELRAIAATGQLTATEPLLLQTRRMLRDPRVRRLATEFACQWLHIHDFEHLDEKSERHFPTFTALRGAMYEESILFFTDLFQNDRSILNIVNADYTFLNELLAKHYGIPGVTGPEWRRVDGVKSFGRGGILAQATTLSKQSGASRTSPILRGNWISEVLLGERLPRPPKDVPRLPEDEAATEGLSVRQLVEKHSSDPKCVVCHQRIDAFGFSLEAFDAIGRKREKDLGDRPIDTRVKTMEGARFEGIEGLRTYLLTQRRDAFVRQFCRKLLGYALGRAMQLSDEPLLAEMMDRLKANDYRFTAALTTIVRSPQFRAIRGRLAALDE